MKRNYLLSRTVNFIAKPFLASRFRIQYIRDINLKNIERPYFIFGNHCTFLDPFILSCGNPQPVNFVTNDEYFRFKTVNFLLKLTGAVPKTKFMTDAVAVRHIFRLKRDGSAIGIYPEGGRTWPGKTQPLLYPTAKLVKKMGIPVVAVLTKGASLSTPRWAVKFRKGKIFVDYTLLLSPEQISAMTTDEIHQKLSEALAHDEATWQRKVMIPFHGKKLAERLEWFIYACPKCKSFETMTSSNDLYSCGKCGYTVRYNEYGFFTDVKDNKPANPDNVNEWNDLQFRLMKKKIADLKENEVLLKNPSAALYAGQRGKSFLEKINEGELTLTDKGMTIHSDIGNSEFDFQGIESIIINHKNTVDFYYNGLKLRITLDNKLRCGYIWEDAVKALKENFELRDR